MEGNDKEKETEEKVGSPGNTAGEIRAGGDEDEKKGREKTENNQAKEADPNTSASGYVRQLSSGPPARSSLIRKLSMKGQWRIVVRNVSGRTRTSRAVHQQKVGNVRKGIRSPRTRPTTRIRTSRSTFSKNYMHQNGTMQDQTQHIGSRSVQTLPDHCIKSQVLTTASRSLIRSDWSKRKPPPRPLHCTTSTSRPFTGTSRGRIR